METLQRCGVSFFTWLFDIFRFLRYTYHILSQEVCAVSEYVKIPVSNYTMKMRLYPSAAQKEKIDLFIRALHVAYNMTFHEVFEQNPAVCKKPDNKGFVKPDFSKMANRKWLDELRRRNSIVSEVPAAALSNQQGLFLGDAKLAWETGMFKRPISLCNRKDFHFYSKNHPRRSFTIQLETNKISPSETNPKVAWIKLPKIDGRIKARGFNRKLWFGENADNDFQKALDSGNLTDKYYACISKDSCGDYFISITFSDGKNHDRKLFLETPCQTTPQPVGIDVGIKDVAILNNGQKIENKHFKKEKDAVLRRMNRQLSRRWGPANIAFRDYNHEIRKEHKKEESPLPPPVSPPSNRYLNVQRNKARLERKIARRRDTYYHQATAAIIQQSSTIAVETLHVKNMLRNHKLAYALSDAAMSDFVSKLKYKCERANIPLLPIGTFEPSSQLCSVCGELYPKAKNLNIRFWTCPHCQTRHDRDVNAAKNILAIALKKGATADKEQPAEPKPKPRRKPVQQAIFPDFPDYSIQYSKELSKHHDPRYIIIDRNHNTIDDAQGAGYRSISNAKNCFKAKKKWSA